MLREPRTLAEVFETARRVYGEPENVIDKWRHYYLTYAALKGCPGDFLSDAKRTEIRRTAVEVVRGAK